jgi:hypothetical protein
MSDLKFKIKSLSLKNFGGFSDFKIEYNDNVTWLVGINGAGKTTVGLTGIWAALKGIAERGANGQLTGDRKIFIGPEKATADAEILLISTDGQHKIIAKNHITKAANQISFRAEDGDSIDPNFVSDLLNVALMSAKNFSLMSAKDQALSLGIDTSEYDDEIKALKKSYTEINSVVRSFGKLEEVEKVERVSSSEIVKQIDEIDQLNAGVDAKIRAIDDVKFKLDGKRSRKQNMLDEIERLKKEIEKEDIDIKKGEAWLDEKKKSLPEKKDKSSLVESLNNIDAINQKASAYESYVAKSSELKTHKDKLEENKKAQEDVENKRLEFIKSFNFDVDGLSVDENGGLLYKERPIKEPYLSKGEMEVVVAKLHASINPDLKVRFVDDFDLLDDYNQQLILDTLLSQGFQIIAAKVANKPKSGEVFLKECKIENGDENNF